MKTRDSYFLGLSPQSISKSMLGLLSIEGRIFLSKQNLTLGIFSFCYGKLGLFTEGEFMSETDIGFIFSSKLKFRYMVLDFWLGETSGIQTLV